MDLYGSLAQLYDTDKDDPRLYKLVKKVTDKGIDPHKWLEAKISGGAMPDAEARDPRQDTSFMGGAQGSRAKADPIEMAKPGIAARALQGAVSPSTRRQFERGVSDSTTFGLAEKAGNLVDSDFQASGKTDSVDSPNARMAGQIAGAFMPGGMMKLGQLAGRGVGALGRLGARAGAAAADGAGAVVGGALGGAVGGALSVPVVSGVSEGIQAAVKGPLEDAPGAAIEGGKAALRNPIAMAAGVGLGALGGLSQGIRSSNTRTGEDIRAIEEGGGKPGVFRGASGGAFDEAPLAGRRGTTADVGEVAREAGDQIRGGLNRRMDAASQKYGEGLERIKRDEFVAQPSPRRREAAPLDASLGSALERTQVTRVAKNPNWKLEGQTSRPLEGPTTGPGPGALSTEPVRAAAEKLLASKRLPESAKAGIRNEVLKILDDNPTMSVEDFNDFRGKLQDLSKVGEASSQSHFRTLYKEAKAIIDETEFGKVNSEYSKAVEASKRAHRQLGVGKNVSRTELDDPIAGKKVARVVRRQEENTSTAGQEAVDVGRFVAENPEFARLLQSSKLMAAKGRMRLGVPEGGGLYERVAGLATRNVEPILGGIAYPAGQAIGGTGAALVPPAMHKLQQALEEQRRRDQERAQMLAP